MMTTTANVRFTINFVKKEITGSKASFKKAGKGFGPEYEELAAKIARHPDFALVEIEPKKRSNKKKETYEGLNEPFMRNYIRTKADSAKYMAELDEVKKGAEKYNKSVYPLMKKWFLDTFSVEGHFDMDQARAEINAYVITVAKNAAFKVVNGQPEQEAEQATEKKGEVINVDNTPVQEKAA